MKRIVDDWSNLTKVSRGKFAYKGKKAQLLPVDKKKKNIKRNQLAPVFFDETRPCPPEIKNCVALREAYKNDVKKLESFKLCTSCNISFLKSNIIASFDID